MIATEKQVIGKEANELEQVETGLIDGLDQVQTMYKRDQSAELRERLCGMPVGELRLAREGTGRTG